MKKYLILTCSTGEGHNSAARAVRAALEEEGVACEQKDPVSFKSERARKFISSFYNTMIRYKPAAFGRMYRIGGLYDASRLPSPVYWANTLYARPLRAYIEQNGFDGVVCTHLYGMEAMTAIRQDPSFSVPCWGVLTDYTCIPFLGDTRLTGYFLPLERTKRELAEKGVPEERIRVTGIPVDPRFRIHPDKRETRRALSLPEGEEVYLIMMGGVGCENMEALCRTLLAALRGAGTVLVMVGRNEEMKRRLERLDGAAGRLRAVPFTREVERYLAAADVLLTKPGGLTSTEAAVANIPIVHVNAIPGCETCNAQYFSEAGMSLWAKSDGEAAAFAMTLARDGKKAESMRAAQRRLVNPFAAEEIAHAVMQAAGGDAP